MSPENVVWDSERRRRLSTVRTSQSREAASSLLHAQLPLSQRRTLLSQRRTLLPPKRTLLPQRRTLLSRRRTLLSQRRTLLPPRQTHLLLSKQKGLIHLLTARPWDYFQGKRNTIRGVKIIVAWAFVPRYFVSASDDSKKRTNVLLSSSTSSVFVCAFLCCCQVNVSTPTCKPRVVSVIFKITTCFWCLFSI